MNKVIIGMSGIGKSYIRELWESQNPTFENQSKDIPWDRFSDDLDECQRQLVQEMVDRLKQKGGLPYTLVEGDPFMACAVTRMMSRHGFVSGATVKWCQEYLEDNLEAIRPYINVIVLDRDSDVIRANKIKRGREFEYFPGISKSLTQDLDTNLLKDTVELLVKYRIDFMYYNIKETDITYDTLKELESYYL